MGKLQILILSNGGWTCVQKWPCPQFIITWNYEQCGWQLTVCLDIAVHLAIDHLSKTCSWWSANHLQCLGMLDFSFKFSFKYFIFSSKDISQLSIDCPFYLAMIHQFTMLDVANASKYEQAVEYIEPNRCCLDINLRRMSSLTVLDEFRPSSDRIYHCDLLDLDDISNNSNKQHSNLLKKYNRFFSNFTSTLFAILLSLRVHLQYNDWQKL